MNKEEENNIVKRITQEIREGKHGYLGPTDERIEEILLRSAKKRARRTKEALDYIRELRNG